MIGQISGELVCQSKDHVLVRTGGVGYVVYCTENILSNLPALGETVTLYTDLLVQENNLQLFGFTTLEQKRWYRLLMMVSGIGAKGAIAILNKLDIAQLSDAIILGNWQAVKTAPGIGPKIAQRVVNELKDKVAPFLKEMEEEKIMQIDANRSLDDVKREDNKAQPFAMADTMSSQRRENEENLSLTHMSPRTHAQSQSQHDIISKEALSALINLGYEASEALRAISKTRQEGDGDYFDTLIRSALKKLVKT